MAYSAITYQFEPNFIDVEQFAYRYSFRKVIDIDRAFLAELQIETGDCGSSHRIWESRMSASQSMSSKGR